MTQIGCPECGHAVEIANGVDFMPEKAACPSCDHEFFISQATDLGSETAVLQKERSNRGAMLDIALVGHLRVSGSMGLDAPSPLREGKTVVGREGADIVADDQTLSAQHFEIESRDQQFLIRDLGSTNGTQLNGETLTDVAPLKNGDRITAGKTTFVFRTLETIPWNPPE